jgi:hypothetical protein
MWFAQPRGKAASRQTRTRLILWLSHISYLPMSALRICPQVDYIQGTPRQPVPALFRFSLSLLAPP